MTISLSHLISYTRRGKGLLHQSTQVEIQLSRW